jgi:ABC-type transport system substrate-binding protein
MAVNGLRNLGINATLAVVNWSEFYSRVLTPSLSVRGKTYAQGGYDIAAIGWLLGADPNPYWLYSSSQFSPIGANYYLWNNSENDYLCNRIFHEMNQTELQQLLYEEQALVYEEDPSVALYYPDFLIPIANNLSPAPIAASYDYSWPAVETWNYTSNPSTNVTLGQQLTGTDISTYGFTLLAQGWPAGMTSQALASPIFGEGSGYGLLKRGAAGTLDVEPYMAYGNYTHSTNYQNWNFTIRPGITFQDGENLTAQDVVYTLRYMMTKTWCYGYNYGSIQPILGSNTSVYWAGEQGTPGASEPLNKYEVQFSLPENYTYFLQEICTLPILPCSVLVNSSTGIPDYANWNPNPYSTMDFVNTSFNTGTGSCSYYAKNGTPCSCSGPFGAGPYEFASYNPDSGVVHLTKFMGYFNRTQLEAAGEYKITDYYVTPYANVSDAISALKAGDVQVLDASYNFQSNATVLSELNPSFCYLVVLNSDLVQEVGFNMQSPIFGTGLGTPVGMANASQAAQAALDMRLGIEYLFLKDSIVKNLTNGYGTYGVTSVATPAMFGFDSNIVLRNDTTLNQRLLAIKYFEAAGYNFYVDLTQSGVNATTPGWTLGVYGFDIATSGAGNVSVIFYTAAPPGTAGAPNGAVPVVYLDVTGFKLPGSTQTILYVYYNRTRVIDLGVNESRLALYVWNTTTTPEQWSPLVSTHLVLNSTTGVVFAVAPHFSYFAVFAGTPQTGSPGVNMTAALLVLLVVVFMVAVVLAFERRRGRPRSWAPVGVQ